LENIHLQLEKEKLIPRSSLSIPTKVFLKRILLAAVLIPLVLCIRFWIMQNDNTYAQHFVSLSSKYIKDEKSSSVKNWITAYEKGEFELVIKNLQPCLNERECDLFYNVYLGVSYLNTDKSNQAENILRQVKESNIHERRKIVAQYYLACAVLEQGKIEDSKRELEDIVNHQESFLYTEAAANLLNIIK
jgi:Putative Zn-dependent protease, contains TPR repeats